MSFHSPRQSQNVFQFDASTPPPPPPKPSAHSSGTATPQTGPPLPPPPPQSQSYEASQQAFSQQPYNPSQLPPEQDVPPIQPPDDGWLPEILKDKTTPDLHHILQTPSLQTALIHNPSTTHPSLPTSTLAIQTLLSQNITLSERLKALETHLRHQRQQTQSRLLSLRALERQWQAKQAEQDAALRDFSPPAMYQRLSAAVTEQEQLCRGLEESFLEGGAGGGDGIAGNGGGDGGKAGEREVVEFVRRLREGRKVAYLREERKERWDEGRVGGWR